MPVVAPIERFELLLVHIPPDMPLIKAAPVAPTHISDTPEILEGA
jgi:hypothetical protein